MQTNINEVKYNGKATKMVCP